LQRARIVERRGRLRGAEQTFSNGRREIRETARTSTRPWPRTSSSARAPINALGVRAHGLRPLTGAIPRLFRTVLEAEEQALHEAEAMLREALRDEDKRRRIAAAGYLLRDTEVGRRRGR
jgi:hypothetical protein